MPGAFISIWHIYFRTVYMKGFKIDKTTGKDIGIYFQNVSCNTRIHTSAVFSDANIGNI